MAQQKGDAHTLSLRVGAHTTMFRIFLICFDEVVLDWIMVVWVGLVDAIFGYFQIMHSKDPRSSLC